MTAKALVTNIFRRGKQVFETFVKETAQKARVHQIVPKTRITPDRKVAQFSSSIKDGMVKNLWRTVVPRFYFNGVASRVTKQAAWRRGGSAFLFAFNTGLVMARNSDNEVSNFVQNFVKDSQGEDLPLFVKVHQLSLDKFEFGRHIGQGCNAAVYEARLIEDSQTDEEDIDHVTPAMDSDQDDISSVSSEVTDDVSDSESDITVLSSDEDDCEAPTLFQVEEDLWTEVTEEDLSDTESDISLLDIPDDDSLLQELDDHGNIVLPPMQMSELSIMSHSEVTEPEQPLVPPDDVLNGNLPDSPSMEYMSLNSQTSIDTGQKFDLAIKMMFNYGIDSNAAAILRAMEREAVPSMLAQANEQMDMWQNGTKVRKKSLPPHPNIVQMWGVFVGQVPHLPDCLSNYPAALPARIFADGIGRNMTMFLVMKKYPTTLKDYVSVVSLSFRERLFLLAQLLEGVAHMGKHEIAHRDMKSDNILLDIDIEGPPQLVISDFGCCLADTQHGMRLPYVTEHTDRGGNTALMAPEIATAEPSMFSYLDYRKADLWGAGAMAYEILGKDNPFYTTPNKGRLDSRVYTSNDLPPLPEETPTGLKMLIEKILERNPNKRPTPRLAADIVQLLLWAPSHWLLPGNQLSRSEVMWWVITMATEVHFGTTTMATDIVDRENTLAMETCDEKVSVTKELKKSFLQDFNLNRLQQAFGFLGVDILSERINIDDVI